MNANKIGTMNTIVGIKKETKLVYRLITYNTYTQFLFLASFFPYVIITKYDLTNFPTLKNNSRY